MVCAETAIQKIKQASMKREQGLNRLTYEDISESNQHFIATYFISEDIKEAIGLYASGDLLDIGCGNKPYAPLFAGRVKNYTGCDIVQSSNNVVDTLCPADQLNFENEAFDTAFCTQVMEHVSDHLAVAKEAYRVLKKGGYGIFTVPFSWELHEEPYDFFRFTKYGLNDLFQKAGFQIVRIKSNGGKWAAIFQLWLNVLLSTRKYVTIRSRVIKFFFLTLKLIVLYNKFAVWLDNRYHDDVLTLNYIVVVRKQ
jgi:SAM-dependent methyltransferase